MVKLSDGKEYTADLYKLTISEVRIMLSAGTDKEAEDKLLAKAFGLKPEAIGSLPYPDYQALIHEMVEALRKPLENPT